MQDSVRKMPTDTYDLTMNDVEHRHGYNPEELKAQGLDCTSATRGSMQTGWLLWNR